MKNFFDKILRPQKIQLIYFGIFISPILIYGLLVISLSWMIGDLLLKAVYIGLFISLIATWLHDRYNNTKLKYYIYLTTVLLTVYIILLFPNRQYLRTKSEERGIELGEYIVKYKKQYGKYPDSLNNAFFNEAPQRSYFGTKFQITTYIDKNGKDTNCFIEYPSLNGYFGIYPIKTKKWHYVD